MNSPLLLALAAAAGVVLGLVFYGGLWWTVRRGLTARNPALWFSGSLLLRLALVGAGFYLVTEGQWPRLVACLTGFLLARILVMIVTAKREARHAP